MKSELIVKHFKKIPSSETKALLQQLKAQKIDVEQGIDWASCDSENGIDGVKEFVFEQYGINIAETPKDFYERVKSEMEKQTLQEDEATRQAEVEAVENEKRQLKEIKEQKGLEKLQQKYENLKDYLKFVLKSEKVSLGIILGDSGLGKTYTLLQQIPDATIIRNKLTPLEFYEILLKNPEANLVLDDVANWKDFTEQIMSATDTLKTRIVHYHVSRTKLPKSSTFKGKIFIISNESKENVPQQLTSRGLVYELKLNRIERIALIYKLAEKLGIPKEIPNFIEEKSTKATRIDFRNLIKIDELRIVFPNKWKILALNELEENEDLRKVMELETQDVSVKEKVKKWIETTGKSRRTYFLKKKSLSGN